MKAAKHPRARSRATERHNKKQPVPNLTAERLQASAALLPARYHVPAVGFEPTRSCLQWPPNQSRNLEACLVDAENAEHTRHRQLATRCRVARRRAYWRRSARTRTHKALNTSIVQRTNATDNNQAPGVVRRPYAAPAARLCAAGAARKETRTSAATPASKLSRRAASWHKTMATYRGFLRRGTAEQNGAKRGCAKCARVVRCGRGRDSRPSARA